MRTSKAKPTSANIVDVIRRELAGQNIEVGTLMAAAQALGIVKAKERYETHETKNARSQLIREALEVFGSSKAERKQGGRVAWRRTVFELWEAGKLDAKIAGDIVREHVSSLAAKIKAPWPKARQTYACTGDMSGRYFKLEHATVMAVCKAVDHMNYWSQGFVAGELFEGPRINRLVNEMICRAAEAVTGFIPDDPLGFRVPYVLEAFDETEEERETRLMLESLSK